MDKRKKAHLKEMFQIVKCLILNNVYMLVYVRTYVRFGLWKLVFLDLRTRTNNISLKKRKKNLFFFIFQSTLKKMIVL